MRRAVQLHTCGFATHTLGPDSGATQYAGGNQYFRLLGQQHRLGAVEGRHGCRNRLSTRAQPHAERVHTGAVHVEPERFGVQGGSDQGKDVLAIQRRFLQCPEQPWHSPTRGYRRDRYELFGEPSQTAAIEHTIYLVIRHTDCGAGGLQTRPPTGLHSAFGVPVPEGVLPPERGLMNCYTTSVQRMPYSEAARSTPGKLEI